MIRLLAPSAKRPATVDELSTLVKSHVNDDEIVRLGDMKLENDMLVVNGRGCAIRENGFKDLLSKIHMPLGYAASIPTDLLYDSVNRLLKTYGDFDVLMRTQDGEVRGVLEPTYVPLDVNVLTERLRKTEGLGLVPARLTYDGDSLTASLVSEKTIHATDVGDVTQMGITLETSDTNRFELSAGAYLYRLVCTNGAIVPAMMGGGINFSQKKVNPDTVWNLFDDGYQRILKTMSEIDSDFLIRLQGKTVDASGWIKAKDKLSKFASGRKVAEILKGMEGEAKEKGTDFNFYDIYNAVTATARDEASLYSAQNLEKAAGELLYAFGTEKN